MIVHDCAATKIGSIDWLNVNLEKKEQFLFAKSKSDDFEEVRKVRDVKK